MTLDIRANLGAQRLAGQRARHTHSYRPQVQDDGIVHVCVGRFGCGRVRDEARAKAGRSARKRGNARELELARELGGVKVGMYGGPEDVRAGMFNVQSKVRAGAAFPGWQWDELAKLPRSGGRVPVLIVTDAPGHGIRRRAVVVVTLDDWRGLHGEETP